MMRATNSATGTLQSVMVKEGDIVAAGDRVAVLGVAAQIEHENFGEAIAKGLKLESLAARAKAEAALARLQVKLDANFGTGILPASAQFRLMAWQDPLGAWAACHAIRGDVLRTKTSG